MTDLSAWYLDAIDQGVHKLTRYYHSLVRTEADNVCRPRTFGNHVSLAFAATLVLHSRTTTSVFHYIFRNLVGDTV